MKITMIRLYRMIPFRPKCQCGHPESCSEFGLALAKAGATLGLLATVALSCNSAASNPCMPNDPNNPNACQTNAPVGQPA